MNKAINFNVKEVLPSLLGKNKTQTIREIKVAYKYKSKTTYEPPKYQVGDEVQLVWTGEEKYVTIDNTYVNRYLGKVKITEVFEIKMGKNKIMDYRELTDSINQIAKRDGFKSVEEMFKVIDKLYDLSKPKRFYVYRWEWLNTLDTEKVEEQNVRKT